MYKLFTITSLCLSVILVTVLVFTMPKVSIMSSTTNCCAIVVERLEDNTAVVFYESSIPEESHFIYVEVEYPEEDITDEEHLQFLIEEVIQKFQEYCYHNHYNGG